MDLVINTVHYQSFEIDSIFATIHRPILSLQIQSYVSSLQLISSLLKIIDHIIKSVLINHMFSNRNIIFVQIRMELQYFLRLLITLHPHTCNGPSNNVHRFQSLFDFQHFNHFLSIHFIFKHLKLVDDILIQLLLRLQLIKTRFEILVFSYTFDLFFLNPHQLLQLLLFDLLKQLVTSILVLSEFTDNTILSDTIIMSISTIHKHKYLGLSPNFIIYIL